MSTSWKNWNPGLDNDEFSLKEILSTLPGNKSKDINFLVKLFEGPKSPIAFKGAISLERHDAVHAVLGRGLLPQDEAFVIGFTMGTSKNITQLEITLFKIITRYIYPKPYNFNEAQSNLMVSAINLGAKSDCSEIYNFPFEDNLEIKMGDLRNMLGLDKEMLKSHYQLEKELLPDSAESKRL